MSRTERPRSAPSKRDATTSPDVARVIDRILAQRATTPPARSVLVAVSGIDGSGKGYLSDRIVAGLRAHGLHAVAITIDGWLNLPQRRFSETDPGLNFYLHAIRFDEMFATLVVPLRDRRSHTVDADYTDETATAYRRHRHSYDNVDVIVLEGIFLLKPALRAYYDLSVWIDCTFATALERAVARAQEGLPPAVTTHAYETIYFPAQRIHLDRDDPRRAATLIVDNDPRLDGSAVSAGAGNAPAIDGPLIEE